MRVRRLELIRYGKFAGRALDLPRGSGAGDFHVIVGPNEAGKSTIRAALSDLLYGFATRSPYGFVHGLSELRLGATLEHEGSALAFQRKKGNVRTLRTVNDEALPDDALRPYLGNTDRQLF